jgi:hypothetical protein
MAFDVLTSLGAIAALLHFQKNTEILIDRSPNKECGDKSCAPAAVRLLQWRRVGLRNIAAVVVARNSRLWVRNRLVRLVDRKTL